MQLDYAQRRLVNIAVARAKAHERELLAQERADMIAELATLKANIIGDYEAMREELGRLREYFQTHRTYIAAKQEVAATYRRHSPCWRKPGA